MRRLTAILLFGLFTASGHGATPSLSPKDANNLPAGEWKMLREVAVNYDLSDDATWVLAAIRKHENGRPGLEFGVGGPMNSKHPAHRYQDGVKSFYVQAMWAAGTVRAHYTGDLAALGRYYNPKDADNWSSRIMVQVTRLKRANSYRLPGVRPAKKPLVFP